MTPADVPMAEEVSDLAFHEVDRWTHRAGRPAPERRTPQRSETWIRRTARFLDTDPGGCWVAVDESGVVGFATSIVRERVWVLATFAVRPGQQGRGIGRAVLEPALAYGAACDRGLLSASEDPRALHRYHAAGFALYPQLFFRGEVDRSRLPSIGGLRAGQADDLAWMDDLDRALRGGPHGPDHSALSDMARLVVARDRSGYAYTTGSETYVVAASTPEVGTRLLWECLAGAEGVFEVSHVTTANQWAVEVAMNARLAMSTDGFLAVRGMDPPAPYVHNGALL